MATVVIQKRKRKNHISYVINYRDPISGRKKYYKTFQRLRDAQQAANDLRSIVDSGGIYELKDRKAKLSLMTFAEVSASLQKVWASRLVEGSLKPKTCEDYTYRVKILAATFGNQLLCEISKNDLLEYRTNIAAEFSNVTSNRSLFILKQIFKHGKEIRAVVNDPAASITYLSEKVHERNRFLLPQEIEILVKACQKIKAKHYLPAMVFLGAEHGASKQEILSLKWSDIRFEYYDQGIIRFFRTKNNKERTEFLMPRTKKALLHWQKHQSWMRKRKRISEVKSNFVFCRLDGNPIKRFDSAWKAVCQIAGLEDLHFHDLRHTFCSNLLLAGADLKDVKEMIGHSDLAMTDRYSHLTNSHKQLRQAQLAKHYEENSATVVAKW